MNIFGFCYSNRIIELNHRHETVSHNLSYSLALPLQLKGYTTHQLNVPVKNTFNANMYMIIDIVKD